MDKHSFFDIKSHDSEVTVHIYGVIGQSWFEESIQAQTLVKEIDSFPGKYTKAKFRINSPGGSLYDGLPIYNAIKRLSIDTETYIDGMAYSMAAIIALAGKKIISAKNGMFLLHTPIGAVMGNAKDFRISAENLDRYGESLMQSIIDRTGLSAEEIKEKWFDYEDHLMTASEAKEFGFIDEISDQSAKIDKEKNINDINNFFDTKEIQNVIPFQSLCNSITTAINAFSENNAQGQSDQAANEYSPIKKEMKQFKNLNAALVIDQLEAVDEAVSLNEEQLGLLDVALAVPGELQQQIDTANTTIGERDTTIADLTGQVETATGTIAERDTTIEQLNQQIESLKAKPADTGAQAHKNNNAVVTAEPKAISDKYENPFEALDEISKEYLGKPINK